MRKYRYVLVPDFEGQNLSGHLSHNLRFISEDKIKYIGILSHLSKLDTEQDIEYFVSLSGPEPQRKILEKKIISQLKNCKIIARYGVGVDNVDLKAACEAGIVISNVPDYCMEEVSDNVVAFILGCQKKYFN